jgi:hypothetical protein
MIDRWGVIKEGKLLTVWGWEYQARQSATDNGGTVIYWRHKVGQP